jgi:hypothetical protein
VCLQIDILPLSVIPVATGRLFSSSNLIEERGAQRFPDALTLLEAGIFEVSPVDSLNV